MGKYFETDGIIMAKPQPTPEITITHNPTVLSILFHFHLIQLSDILPDHFCPG